MYKTIDLFAGAGGLSLGFAQTGKFEILAAAEIEPNARTTYKYNIAKGKDDFVFINDVVGYDFKRLRDTMGGIDVVIGGPPCQGFSNANRQKNNLVSMNNSLIKEYFRAIKEIEPTAFVLENVSMLKSSVHRFYDSRADHDEIEKLIGTGKVLPKRDELVYISPINIAGINILEMATNLQYLNRISIPSNLFILLNTLGKNRTNARRLPKFIAKNGNKIVKLIDEYPGGLEEDNNVVSLCRLLNSIRNSISSALNANVTEESLNSIKNSNELIEIINFGKATKIINEIERNELIGVYEIQKEEVCFSTRSYAVIDYINAILGDDYVQRGATLNAKDYGVPQYRKRHIIIGVRKHGNKAININFPEAKTEIDVTVGQAIMDLANYEVGYEKEYDTKEYNGEENISDYAIKMRKGSLGVSNHISTSTTEEALKRFESIQQGKNFHSLPSELKGSYSNPERTQNTIYLRLAQNEASGTVVNVRKSMWIHPTLNRAITVREAARLQSFPDSFIFFGTKDSQYQQVGNAVPPCLARAVAESVVQILNSVLE